MKGTMAIIMELAKINLSKIKSELSDDEKVLMVSLGDLYGEIFILLSSVLCSSVVNGDDIIKVAQFSQKLFFLEILSGKLWEGWMLIEKKYFGSKLSERYNEKLDKQDKATIKELKKYFGKTDNRIKHIRDVFAFHYGDDAAKTYPDEFDNLRGDDLFFYISEKHGNCFFNFAESVVIRSLIDMDNFEKDYDSLVREINKIADKLLCFIFGFFKCALKVHNINREQIEYLQIPPPPHFKERGLPYFLSHEYD